MFRNGTGVARYLGGGDIYNSETDSYMSSPMRHAATWAEACRRDNL
jgi:hypothetical protein